MGKPIITTRIGRAVISTIKAGKEFETRIFADDEKPHTTIRSKSMEQALETHSLYAMRLKGRQQISNKVNGE